MTNDSGVGFRDTMQGWKINPFIFCPHCKHRGMVMVRKVEKKRGVSGGKATAAILTAGVSLFATGLSRKEKVMEAKCGNCKMQWLIG